MLQDKVAIVTGAGNGIGRAEALELARLGAKVLVNDVGGPATGMARPADQVVAEIESAGGHAVAHYGDVSDWQSAEAMVAMAVDTFGTLDILVNNAGISRPAMCFNMSEEDWDDVIRVHLKGTFAPSRFAAEYWRSKAKSTERAVNAAIVNTSSGNGLNGGTPGHANYSAAKTGINTLTTGMARELAPYGVRVNAMAPLAYSAMTESLWGTDLFPHDRRPELEPANVAAVVAWLASPASEGITAKVFHVNGSSVELWQGWTLAAEVSGPGAWTFDSISAAAGALFSRIERGLVESDQS
jgi:NAD(P)-dependent dehydrogenase (short-subunit alcohol dehydrogenase family)